MFFLSGMLLPNNSRVLLSDIEEGSGALFCLTDRETCCTNPPRGAWRLPNSDNNIPRDQSSSSDFYVVVVRGSSSLVLNRRSGITGPTGKFTCLIPSASDSDRSSQSLFIGIFNEGTVNVCFFLD